MFSNFAPLASRLLPRTLWAVVPGVLLMSGCLLPQDYKLIDDLPAKVMNRPPRILDDSATPGLLTVLDVGSDCSLTFRASVEDPDTDAVGLRVRWFIDWSQSDPQPFDEDTLQPENLSVQGESVSLTLNVNSAGSPLSLGEHVIEVMVADGEILERQPRQTFDGDGGIVDPRYSDFYAWFVSVKSTDCVP